MKAAKKEKAIDYSIESEAHFLKDSKSGKYRRYEFKGGDLVGSVYVPQAAAKGIESFKVCMIPDHVTIE